MGCSEGIPRAGIPKPRWSDISRGTFLLQINLHDLAQGDQHVNREDWIAASTEKDLDSSRTPKCLQCRQACV